MTATNLAEGLKQIRFSCIKPRIMSHTQSEGRAGAYLQCWPHRVCPLVEGLTGPQMSMLSTNI